MIKLPIDVLRPSCIIPLSQNGADAYTTRVWNGYARQWEAPTFDKTEFELVAQQAKPTPAQSAAAVRAQTPPRGRALPDAYVPGGPAVKLSALVNVPIIITDVGPEKIGGQFNKPMADFTFQRVPDYTSGDDTEYRAVTGSGPLLEQLSRLRGKLPALVCIGQKESPNPRFGPYYTFVDPAEYRDNDDVQITTDDLANE